MVSLIVYRAARPVSVVLLSLGAALFTHSPLAFYCDATPALEDADNYYCGNDRGNYVLRSSGVALVPTGGDENAQLVVREPTGTSGVQDRVLVSWGDPLEFGVWGSGYLGGVGANPDVNASGQVVFIGSTDAWGDLYDSSDYFYDWDFIVGLFVADKGGAPEAVLVSGDTLDDRPICGQGMQPMPQIGDGGHWVTGFAVGGSDGACERGNWGDADGSNVVKYSPDDIDNGYVARITRIVMGPLADATDFQSARDVTLYYEELDGATLDPATAYSYRLGHGWAAPNDPRVWSYYTRTGSVSGMTHDAATSSYSSIGEENDVFSWYSGCPTSGCDIDLVAKGIPGWLGSSTGTVSRSDPGTRYIARGKVGSSVIDVPIKALRSARYAGDDGATEFMVPASNTEAVHPSNPLAVGGQVKFVARTASAMGHSARNINADGSFVVEVGVQDVLAQEVWEGGSGNGFTRTYREYKHGIAHVNAAGDATLIAAGTPAYSQLTKPFLTSDGRVLYRATELKYSEDDWQNYGYEACLTIGGYWQGVDTGEAFPVGADAGRQGSWPLVNNLELFKISTGSQLAGWGHDAGRSNQSFLVVTSNSPAAATDYYIEKHETNDRVICGSAATISGYAAGIASGDIVLRLQNRYLLETMVMAGGNANWHYFKALSDDAAVVYEAATDSRTLVQRNGALKIWNAGTGTTQKAFEFNDVSPAGFSVMRGLPPHYSGGAGLAGFKTQLWSPYNGEGGNDDPTNMDNPYPPYDPEDPVNTILGDAYPCETGWDTELYGPDYDADRIDHDCQAIMVWNGSSLTEVARTKKAGQVFASEDDNAAVGATEADGFEFWGLDPTVMVTETGTVFFMATDEGEGNQDSVCTLEDSLNTDSWNAGRKGVFAYADGEVRKVIAELDTFTDSFGKELTILAISTPQPEMRPAVSGSQILVKFAASTADLAERPEGGCVPDVVGLMSVTTPQGAGSDDPLIESYPDQGTYASVSSPIGRAMISVSAVSAADGWTIQNFDNLTTDNATYLDDEDMSGGLFTFTAVMNANGDAPGALPDPMPPVELELTLDVSPDTVNGLIKDIASKYNLIQDPSLQVAATATGQTRITFSIEDQGEYDFDDTEGVATDPFGAAVLRARQSIPVPIFGQGLWLVLSGLMSLLGGLFAWRRQSI